MCIFPSDGTGRIRFTGQDYTVQSQPVSPAPRRRICFAIYGHYTANSENVNKFCPMQKSSGQTKTNVLSYIMR